MNIRKKKGNKIIQVVRSPFVQCVISLDTTHIFVGTIRTKMKVISEMSSVAHPIRRPAGEQC